MHEIACKGVAWWCVCLCGYNNLRMILLKPMCMYVSMHCLHHSESYTTEASIIYYWGGELILSPVRMWITPQSYRLWCFDCKSNESKGWRRSIVLGILWLKPDATIVMVGLWVVHLFGSLCSWLVSPVTLVFMSQSFGLYLITL
jgi:hypothetical protein